MFKKCFLWAVCWAIVFGDCFASSISFPMLEIVSENL